MGWIGKIVGGTVGLAIGGPLGMIAGIAFGNLFDRAGQMPSHQEGERTFSAEKQNQMVFFVGAFSMLARLATVDGQLHPEERRKVEEFINQDLKLDWQSKRAALRVFETALTSGGTFEQFARQFYENFAHQRELLELMIDILVRVAAADGTIQQSEERLIAQAARIFRIPDSLLASILQRYSRFSTSLAKSYAVLGLEPNASVDEIKRAYRKLSIDFHPDTIASKGLPEEFTAFATEKFRSIQEAYETIKKERNIS